MALLDDAAHPTRAVADDAPVVGGSIRYAGQEGEGGAGLVVLGEQLAQCLSADERGVAVEYKDRVGRIIRAGGFACGAKHMFEHGAPTDGVCDLRAARTHSRAFAGGQDDDPDTSHALKATPWCAFRRLSGATGGACGGTRCAISCEDGGSGARI